jgi:glyoxylase-like metal-dependent hydrolase (beta-lactamase superfamily II)
MHQVVPDVYRMTGLRGVNVYLLASGEDLLLVDSGMPGDADRIASQVQEQGFALSALRAIVLTHAHVDHVGSAAVLARGSGAQVLAHGEEVPYIQRAKPLPTASLLWRILDRLSGRMLRRQPPCQVDRALKDGEIIAALGGLQVVHTPGHTPGSICLYQPERQILFSGDTLFSRNPLSGKQGVQLPPRLLISDIAALRESVRRLAALPVQVLCAGHGEPVLAGAGDRIRALVVGEQAQTR